jgi:hypothetical protein
MFVSLERFPSGSIEMNLQHFVWKIESHADFSYVALVNQTATNGTGTFNEQGAGLFSSYRFPTLPDVVTIQGSTRIIRSMPRLLAVGQ